MIEWLKGGDVGEKGGNRSFSILTELGFLAELFEEENEKV